MAAIFEDKMKSVQNYGNGIFSRWTLTVAAVGIALPAIATTLRYAEDQAPGIVNPVFTTTMTEARVNELLFEGLYTDNEDLMTTPDLASSIEVAEDAMSAVVTLRRDVVWHDGTGFTAADVVFTINAMQNPETLSTEVGRVEWIEEAEALGDYSVELTFSSPQPSPQDKLNFKILPHSHFNGDAMSRGDSFRTNPIGTGPYRLVQFNDDNSVTFEVFDDYRENIGIDELILREVSDKSYQARLLLYESLEALVRVLPSDLALLQNSRQVELYPYQTNSWWFLGFDETEPPFDDIRVRQAVSQLVDVENLLAPIGTGEILSGPYVKSSPFYNHEVEPWTRNEREARVLLEDAGFTQEGGSWERDGEPLSFTITAHQGLETAQMVVINLQSQLRSKGIDVQTEFLDEAEWKVRVWRERDFDSMLSQWSFDRNEDVYSQLHSDGERNFGGYSNDRVDELLDIARNATDPFDKRHALRLVHELVRADAPMLFLWTLDSYAALSRNTRNVLIHPFYFFTYVGNWRMR